MLRRLRSSIAIWALLSLAPEPASAEEPTSELPQSERQHAREALDPNALFNEPYYGIYLTLRSYTAVLDGSAVAEPLLVTYLSFRPLIPIPIAGTGLFLRPSISLVRAPIAAPLPGDDHVFGLGDSALFTAWVPFPAQDLLWGLGPTFIFPTATHDQLGSGHFQVGPGGGLYVFPEPWVFGLIAQQWWSVGGDDPATSRFNLTYAVFFALSEGWQIGTTPDIFVDWKAGEGEKVTLPVGIGLYKVLPFESVPIQIGGEVLYSVVRPSLIGETWVFRFEVTPLWLLREPETE
jgi:hypothetical protein